MSYLTDAPSYMGTVTLVNGALVLSSASGIVLTSGTPGTTANTLYNVAGSLYFNGAAVGGGGGTTPITLSVASAIPTITLTRSDLTASVTLTQTSATNVTLNTNFTASSFTDSSGTTLESQIASVQPTSIAAAIGPWQSYTPVWTGTTTNPVIGNGSIGGMWRRVGDTMELEVTIVMGSTTTYGSGSYGISIPSGYNIDFTKVSNNNYADFGIFFAQGGSGGSTDGIVRAVSSVTNVLYPWFSLSNVSPTVPFTFANGNTLTLRAVLPITQWSANINLVKDFTEYVSCDGSAGVAANASYTPTTVYGLQGSLIPSVTISSTSATTVTGYTLSFNNTIQASDRFFLEISGDSGITWEPIEAQPGTVSSIYYPVQNVLIGIQWAIISNKQVIINFSNAGRLSASFGVGSGTWAQLNTIRWRVRKTSNGNFAQGSPSYSITNPDTSNPWIITHNLGVTDVDVAIFETGGNKRKVDSGVEIRSISTTQVSVNFASAPAAGAYRATVFSSGGTSNNAVENYSTSEVMTNKVWYNSKTIYRKVLTNVPSPNNNTRTTAHGISGITEIISITGTSNIGSNFQTLPAVSNNNITNQMAVTADLTNVYLTSTANYSSYINTVILEYTK